MDQSAIGADDHRVVAYARLVDPAVWPEGLGPEVNPITAPRLRFSLEAGYRIACHEGGVVDPTDVVERLCIEIGLDDEAAPIQTIPGIDPAELASLAAVLMGQTGDDEDAEAAPTPASGPASEDEDADEVVLRRPGTAMPDEDGADGHDGADDTEDEIDPDHDPEAGISHVGDADEGQHHEER